MRTATGVTDTLMVNEIKNNSGLLMFLQLTLTYSLPCWTRLRESLTDTTMVTREDNLSVNEISTRISPEMKKCLSFTHGASG